MQPHNEDHITAFVEPPATTPFSAVVRLTGFLLAVVVILAALIVPALLPSAVADWVASLPSDGERARSVIETVPGIAVVDDPEARMGDLTMRDNVFLVAEANSDLSPAEVDTLVLALAEASAELQGHSRLMIELILPSMSVGISPIASVNPPRMQLARSLAEVEGVIHATVLWHTSNDDLILDTSNERLNVWVQAREETEADLVARATPSAQLLSPAPSIRPIIVGDGPLHERLWSWR